MKTKKNDSLKKEKKSKRGGIREGSGRKPNADFTIREMFKQAFDRNFKNEDWDNFIIFAKSDPKLITYIIDQRIGKATQAIEHSGGVEIDLLSKIIEEIDGKTKGLPNSTDKTS